VKIANALIVSVMIKIEKMIMSNILKKRLLNCIIFIATILFITTYANVGLAQTGYDHVIDFNDYKNPKDAVRAFQDALNDYNKWSDKNNDRVNDSVKIYVTGELDLNAGHATRRKVHGVVHRDQTDNDQVNYTRTTMNAPYSTIWLVSSVGAPPHKASSTPHLNRFIYNCPGIDRATGYPVACYSNIQPGPQSAKYGILNIHFDNVRITYHRGNGGFSIPEAEDAVVLFQVGDHYLKGPGTVDGENLIFTGQIIVDVIGSPTCCSQAITGIGMNSGPGSVNPFDPECPDQGNLNQQGVATKVCRGSGTADVLNNSGLKVVPGTGPRWDSATGKGYRYAVKRGVPAPTGTTIASGHLVEDAHWSSLSPGTAAKVGSIDGDGYIDDEQFVRPIGLGPDGFWVGVRHPEDLDGNGVLDDGIDEDVFIGMWFNGVALIDLEDFSYAASAKIDPARGASAISGSAFYDHKTVGIWLDDIWTTEISHIRVQGLGVGIVANSTLNISVRGGAARANRTNFQIGLPYPSGCTQQFYKYNSYGFRNYAPVSAIPADTVFEPTADYPHHATSRQHAVGCGGMRFEHMIYESGSPQIAVLDSRKASFTWYDSYTEQSFPKTTSPFPTYYHAVAIGAGINSISGQYCISDDEASRQTYGATCLIYNGGRANLFSRGRLTLSGGSSPGDYRSYFAEAYRAAGQSNLSVASDGTYKTKGPFIDFHHTDGIVFGEGSQTRLILTGGISLGGNRDSLHCGSPERCHQLALCFSDTRNTECDLDLDGTNETPLPPYILFNYATEAAPAGDGDGGISNEIIFESFVLSGLSSEDDTVYHDGGFLGQFYQSSRSFKREFCPPSGTYNNFFQAESPVELNASRLGDVCIQSEVVSNQEVKTPRKVEMVDFPGNPRMERLDGTRLIGSEEAAIPVSAPLIYPANDRIVPGTGLLELNNINGLHVGDVFSTYSCEESATNLDDNTLTPTGTCPAASAGENRYANGPRALHKLWGYFLADSGGILMGQDWLEITWQVNEKVKIADEHPFKPGGAINFSEWRNKYNSGADLIDQTLSIGDTTIEIDDASKVEVGDWIRLDSPIWADTIAGNLYRTEIKVVDVDLTQGQGLITLDWTRGNNSHPDGVIQPGSYFGAGKRASIQSWFTFQAPTPVRLTDKTVDDASISVGDTTLTYSVSGSDTFTKGSLIQSRSASAPVNTFIPIDANLSLFLGNIAQGSTTLNVSSNDDIDVMLAEAPLTSTITFRSPYPTVDSGLTVSDTTIGDLSSSHTTLDLNANAGALGKTEKIDFLSAPTGDCQCEGNAALCASKDGCYLTLFSARWDGITGSNDVMPALDAIVIVSGEYGSYPTNPTERTLWSAAQLNLMTRAYPIGTEIALWRSNLADTCPWGDGSIPEANLIGLPNTNGTGIGSDYSDVALGVVTGYGLTNDGYPILHHTQPPGGLSVFASMLQIINASINCPNASITTANGGTSLQGMQNRVYLRGAGLPTNFEITSTSSTNVMSFSLPGSPTVGLSMTAEWADLGTATWTEAWPLNGAKVMTNDHGVGEYEVTGITAGTGDIFSTDGITFPTITISPGLKTSTQSATNLPFAGDQVIVTASAQVGGAAVSSTYQIIDVDDSTKTLHLTPPLHEPLPTNTDDIYTSDRGHGLTHIVHASASGGAPNTGGDTYVPLFAMKSSANPTGAGIAGDIAWRVNPLDHTLTDLEIELRDTTSSGLENDGTASLKLSTLAADAQPQIGDTLMVSARWMPEYVILSKDETADTIDVTPGISNPIPWVGSQVLSDGVGKSTATGENAPAMRCKPDLIIKEVINDPTDVKKVKLIFTTNVWEEVTAFTTASNAGDAATPGTQPECLASSAASTGYMTRFKNGRYVKYSGGAGRWGVSSTDPVNNTITFSPILKFRDEGDQPANFWFDTPASQHIILDGDQIFTYPSGVNTFVCDPPGFHISCNQNHDWKKSAPKHGHAWDETSVVEP